MRYRVIVSYSILLLFSQFTFAQYYDSGQDPASLKWMQIKTGRFTVIYPKKYGSGGITYAQSLEEAYSQLGSLYPEKKFKIPVVIHNFTTQPNGYVAWAPRRMELYPTPEQNTIPLSTEKQLAIHELTHVFQMESLHQGFSKAMSLVLGEQFTGVIALLLPLWFLEGDAVFAESVLTESGRGRSPSFQKQLKALAVEKGRVYKYDKIVNGSYRDYVPDHYQSGYQMVTWALAKYDAQLWNKALSYTARQPFTMNPVNISLSRSAGLTKKKLFTEAFDTLSKIWTQEVTANKARLYESINPAKHGQFINYYSPVFAGSDSIIAIKTSLSAPPAFVLINPSKKTENRILIPGQLYPWFISYAKGKLVWVESQPDPRWENRNYSVIKLLDLRNNKITRLSQKSRYMSASVSPDGRMIAAIENTISNENNLVLIDAETASVLQSASAPGNASLQRPQWAAGGREITLIFLSEEGEGIMSYSLADRRWEILSEAGRDDLQSTFLRNDSLFFTSSLSGTDNIYIKTPGGKISGLTRSGFGAIDLCLNGEKVIFSDYTSLGNNICITNLAEASAINDVKGSSESFLINRFQIVQKNAEIKAKTLYTPEPYRKWQHLFKFHSWMPFYADLEVIKADPSAIRPGFSIMSQNQLSTLISSIGYEYSPEKNHVIHSRVTWKGWYPVFESQIDYGNDPIIDKLGTTVGNPSEIQPEMRFLNTVSLPLVFSSGKFSEYLRLSLTSDYSSRYVYLKDESIYDHGQTILSGRIFFSTYQVSALRDIYPRWAQTIDLNYSFAPFDKSIYGSAIAFKSSSYIPGFLPGNGVKFRFEKEKLIPPIFYGNRVSHPRGYRNIISKDIDFISVDYALPLAYPDFNISSLLYLKRIRTNLFYDYARGTDNYFLEQVTEPSGRLTYKYNLHKGSATFRSFGFELMADFHILRIPYLISGGVQTSWKNIYETPSFELLFNIDLFGMTIGRRRL